MAESVSGSAMAGAAYEVLSPWADADPIPLKGLSPRLDDLSGKKIGLFRNNKRAAGLMLGILERRLKERYPAIQTNWYESVDFTLPEIESKDSAQFQTWVKEQDGVVLAVGD